MEKRNFELFIGAMRKAGIPDWPFDFRGDEANRLSGNEMRSVFFGHLLKQNGRMSGESITKFSEDGSYTYRSKNFVAEGKSRIKGNQACLITDNALLGREYCYPMYRNPTGTRENVDEYVWATMYDAYTGSPVD